MRFSEASQNQEFGATDNLFILYTKVTFLCTALLKRMSPSTGRIAALGSCGQSPQWAETAAAKVLSPPIVSQNPLLQTSP